MWSLFVSSLSVQRYEGNSHVLESTCEYRDNCEWREQKSQEAGIALGKRRESN